MEKIWLNSYPAGIPEEINPDVYQSINEIFHETCTKFKKRAAFYNMGVTLTFEQVDQYSEQFAAYLQNVLSLKKGDRIAIMLPNILQYPIALFGALKAGLVIVNVNPLYTAVELAYQLKNAEVSALLALENFANTVEAALKQAPVKHVIITRFGDLFPPVKAWVTHLALKYFYRKIPVWSIPGSTPFKETLSQGKGLTLKPVDIRNDDLALLQYTGGTTGVSKGAMLTHRNIIANILQADAWFDSLLKSSDGQQIIITALPLYHIFSFTANCVYFAKIGGLNVLIANPRDIASVIKDMGQFKFTAVTGVNTLFNALLKNPAFAKLDFSHLRLSLSGGTAAQKAVAEKWQEVTGCVLLEAYGLTETSPCVTVNPTTNKTFTGSIGLPVSSTDVVVLDDQGNEVPLGEPGELAIKGPQVMKGYWHNPAETEKVFTKDGWLLTGDVVSIDKAGFIRILERKKDMVLVSGFNVYPNEIEDVIASNPHVREVAVIGVPDANTGEAVKAFIVKGDPSLSAPDIIHYCRERLTPYKVPKYIEFCDDLPKSNVGKVLRRVLRHQSDRAPSVCSKEAL